MSEREAYESIKSDIKHLIESIRAKLPQAAEYMEKHIVMDDEKMTFVYTGDDRLKMTPAWKRSHPRSKRACSPTCRTFAGADHPFKQSTYCTQFPLE